LADIPVLGLFFRNRTTKSGSGSTSKSDTELFITLTPTIVTEEEQGKLKSQPQAKAEITTPAIVSNLPQPLAGYAGIIQKRILDNLNYPASAREAGFQGAVKLSLRLSYRGELLDAKIKDSSGHKILDDNALAVAKGIDAYPPFPSSMGQKELWIDVPINYRLD
jgi:protein TonB